MIICLKKLCQAVSIQSHRVGNRLTGYIYNHVNGKELTSSVKADYYCPHTTTPLQKILTRYTERLFNAWDDFPYTPHTGHFLNR